MTAGTKEIGAHRAPLQEKSLHDFQRRSLAMAGSGTIQERADGMNRLAIATNDAADVSLTQLHPENGHFATWNLGQHHVVRKLDQLTNDELEKLFHAEG